MKNLDNIVKILKNIEVEHTIALEYQRIDYLFCFCVGRFGDAATIEDKIFFKEIPRWIYNWIIENGYQVKFTLFWDRMIYSITNNEEKAWMLCFKCIYECIDYLKKIIKNNKNEEEFNYKLNIKQRIRIIKNRPGVVGVTEKRIDYISHYFAGIYSKEDENFNSKEFEQITQYIYTYLVSKGYSIEKSKWWHKMIYQITTDEDESWELLFEVLIKYFEQK